MKKIDLGQTLQLLGNAGVIVGILLLVYELNQNRQMMEAQTRHELSQGIVDQFFAGAADPDLVELVIKGQAGALESEIEERQFDWWFFARMRYWEDVHYQYRMGLYDQDEFDAQLRAFSPTFRLPASLELWSSVKDGFSPEFVAAMDELAADLTDE
jgi:hypothetical protein